MASDVAKGESAAKKAEGEQEVVTVELPAPKGWTKKYTPRKSGTPRRSEIVFISPTGEEIKYKRQLDQYLRSHPGGPPSSEFDWGTGDTPRRSARISEKAKATESPESEPPKKKERKSSAKKGVKTKKDTEDGEGAAPEEEGDGVAEDKGDADVDMKEAEVTVDEVKEKAPVDEAKEKAPETVEQVKTMDNVEEETNKEAAEAAIKDTAAKEKEEKAENEKPGDDSDAPPPSSEHKEEKTREDSEIKDGGAVPENGSQKDEAPSSVPSLNCDDGQCQPEVTPINC